MGKNTDAVKPMDQFIAPWETESGSDAEIDKAKLKRYIHNLLVDKAKAQDARDDADAKVTSIEKDLETAKTEAAAANGEEAQKKIDNLEKDLQSAKDKVSTLEAAKAEADLRSEVLEGLDAKYAKYVKGSTREELEKSLEEVKADFGLEDGDPDDDEGDDEEEAEVRTRPRPLLKNAADPKNGKGGEAEIDFDAVANDIVGAGIFG